MRRQPRALYGVVFLDALLMFAIVPLLPGYVRDLHLTKTEVGLVVGIYSGAVLVGSVPVGYLAARVGARRLTIFGVGLLAVATFGCAFAGGFWALLAARTGQGLSSAVSWTAGMAWLSEASEPNVRGRVLGTAMSFATVGTLVGPVIGGVLGSRPGGAVRGGDAAHQRPVRGRVPALRGGRRRGRPGPCERVRAAEPGVGRGLSDRPRRGRRPGAGDVRPPHLRGPRRDVA